MSKLSAGSESSFGVSASRYEHHSPEHTLLYWLVKEHYPALGRLCRYINRPAVSEQRLSLSGDGNFRYPLATPYRDGTTRVM